MSSKYTLLNIANMQFCTGCGTCAGICPQNAISMVIDERRGEYRPLRNEARCKQCGICGEVCPLSSVGFDKMNEFTFGKIPKDVMLGNHIGCYTGYSTDHAIRTSSASGGLITQLLVFALQEGIIDGALVTRWSQHNPLEPEPFIARTEQDLIAASKSKYCPVPANVALKKIINADAGNTFAVVGLPCHIHAIRRAEMLNKKLKERILLHLGIVCGHVPSTLATGYMLHTIGIREDCVRKMEYRGNGWPGKISISLNDGHQVLIPYRHQYTMGGILSSIAFTPLSCILCPDGTAELSDISFGDAWLPQFQDDEIGRSVIIVRTNKGKQLIERMSNQKVIDVETIESITAVESQKRMLNSKKRNLRARIAVSKSLFGHAPYENLRLMRPHIISYISAAVLLVIYKFLLLINLSKILKRIPYPVIKFAKVLGLLT